MRTMGDLLNFYGPDQLACDQQMLDYLTIRINRSQLKQKIFEVKVTQGPVEVGDYLLATLDSTAERYRVEQANICVGKGIWDAAFETALVGLPLGKSLVSVGGTEVTVDIFSIKQKLPADITGEFVQKQMLGGISTKEDYLAALAENYKNQELAARKKTLWVVALNIMRKHSVFAPMDTQVEELYQQQLAARQYKADRKGYTLDDVLGSTPEIRDQKKQEAREKAVQLAQFYEIAKELARIKGRELTCSKWAREAAELASEIIDTAFCEKFQIIEED